MNRYTDIAAELYAKPCGSTPNGVKIHTASASGIHLTRVDILRSGLRRAKGRYITLDMPHFSRIDVQDETFVLAIASQLRTLLPKEGSVLVVGIGNRAVTPDALGPCTADKIFVTTQDKSQGLPLRHVASISPGVGDATGIDTCALLRTLAKDISVACILLIDSLCTATPARLGCSVQISDAGLHPKHAPHLTAETLGAPVIAIGVPTITQLDDESISAPFMVSPKDIDSIIMHASSLLALAINKALQPALRVGELSFLTS